MGEERLGEPPAGSADQVFGQHPFAVASLLATRSGRGSKVAKQHEPIISERPDPIHNRHRFHFYVPFLALSASRRCAKCRKAHGDVNLLFSEIDSQKIGISTY